MKQAYIYIRVSTEEQANKGFSQRNQEERLLKYCSQNNIEILEKTYEDCSAKTFNRPAWLKLTNQIKQHKKKQVLLLFTRWDRFSRNAADAYAMIRRLDKLGVEPQAIDQPLDLSIPENKIMLALYLATSEVENDRRSLNVREGMRKAKREGKWLGKAPIGFIIKKTSSGIKSIEPKEPEAGIIKRAFELVAENSCTISLIHFQAVQSGLVCSQSNFRKLLRNPVYCGKILIPADEKSKPYTVNGLHKNIIAVSLFESVQKILQPKGKLVQLRSCYHKSFPLRGFLVCPSCKKTLTGSKSQGSTKSYNYYHCVKGCKYRVGADLINNGFQQSLRYFGLKQRFIELYRATSSEIYSDFVKKQADSQKRVSISIEKLTDRQINAHELFLTGKIDHEDYLTIKQSCEKNLKDYCIELQEIGGSISHLSKGNCNAALQVDRLYEKANIETKIQLISFLLPDKIQLDNETLVKLYSGSFFENNLSEYHISLSRRIKNGENDSNIINLLKMLTHIELKYVPISGKIIKI